MAASPKAVFLRKIGFFYNVKQNTWNSTKQRTTPELELEKTQLKGAPCDIQHVRLHQKQILLCTELAAS